MQMPAIKLGQTTLLEVENGRMEEYRVAGIDHATNTIWLTTTKEDYDGYSQHGIYQWDGSDAQMAEWRLILSDERCSLPSWLGPQLHDHR